MGVCVGRGVDQLTSDVSRQKEVFSNKVLNCNMTFLEANVEDVRNLPCERNQSL